MKFLGKIFLLLVFAAVVSGVYYWQVLHQPGTDFSNNQHDSTPVRKFTDSSNSFELTYPSKYQFSKEGNRGSYLTANAESQGIVFIPANVFPDTTFAESYIQIAESGNMSSADCGKYVSSAGKAAKLSGTETINGNIFAKAEFSGAAAGNFYETRLYHILHDSTCYEIALTLHTTNIGNYEPGTVIEVNKVQAWDKLDLMMHTFKFANQVVNPSPISPNATNSKTGTLEGNVQIKNTQSSDAYDLTQVIVYSSDRSKIVTKVSLDASGDYSVDLVPGIYYVTYNSIYSHIQPAMTKITISENKSVTQNFTIDN